MNFVLRTRPLQATLRLTKLPAYKARIRHASSPPLSHGPPRGSVRKFSSSVQLLKKKPKPGRDEPPAGKVAADADASSDPLNFDALRAAIQSAVSKLKEDLSKLRAGGRFNPEVLESIRVSVEKGSTNTERLGDLAQVIPKGRTVNIIVGESDHVKPISAAVLASKLNLNPQPDPHNSLQLNIALPPPTADSRKAVVQEATNAADAANNAIKNARAARHKELKSAQSSKAARPDDVRAAGKEMEKIVSDGGTEVKKIVDAAKKVLEAA